MGISSKHTAIILFTRSADKEAVAKKFCGKKNLLLNKKIAQCLIDKSSRVARETKLPFYLIDEKLQHGESFGEKLANAIEDLFSKNYQRLIVIGNDCPGLTKNHILHAAQLLQTAETVAGPASNGGLYLIGINRSSFQKASFENIRWQSPNALGDFTKLNPAIFLDQLGDANNEHELNQQIKLYAHENIFLQTIRSCLASLGHYFFPLSKFCIQPAQLFCAGLRAPPLCWH